MLIPYKEKNYPISIDISNIFNINLKRIKIIYLQFHNPIKISQLKTYNSNHNEYFIFL
jgi:hypothetical protein